MRRLAARFVDKAFLRFLVVGVTNTALSYGVFRTLLLALAESSLRAGTAQAGGYAAGILWSFFWNRKWTFEHEGPWRGQFLRFITLQLILLAVSAVALHLLVDRGGTPATPAWLAVMVFITAVNYVAQRRLVFHDRPAAASTGGRAARVAEMATVAVMIALSAASFGLSYGIDSQNTYLLHGLLAVNPEALPGDWLSHETLAYHATWLWGLLIGGFLACWPVGLAFFNAALTAVSMWIIYRMVAALVPSLRAAALFLILGLLVMQHTWSVGLSWLFSYALHPSSVAGCLLLASLAMFLKGRFALSGVFLGLSGYFHTNFLLLSFPLLGLAHLLLAGDEVAREPRRVGLRVLAQFWLCGLVLLARLPMLLAVAGAAEAEAGRRILIEIRAPHHYLTTSFLPQFIELGAWSLIGLGGLLALVDRQRPQWRRLAVVQVALWLMLGSALVLTTVVFVPTVAQLYIWRLAPFSVLISQVAFIAAAVGLATAGNPGRPRLIVAAVVAAIGIAALMRYQLYYWPVTSPKVLLLGLLLALPMAMAAWRLIAGAGIRWMRLCSTAAAWALLAGCLATHVGYMIHHSTLIEPQGDVEEEGLFAWVRTTPETSRFLVPPEMERFRRQALRAVVADWRSTPLDAAGLVEWYRRMNDITGGAEPRSAAEATQAYAALPAAQLLAIARRYQCDYAVMVLREGQPPPTEGVAYANQAFAVLAVYRDPAAVPPARLAD